MNRPLSFLLLLAALGAGYVVGSQTSGHDDAASRRQEHDALQEENNRLRLALGERGPRLDPGAGLVGRGGPDGGGNAEVFDITKYERAEEAFRALLAFASKKLGEGPDGHLELLDALNANVFDSPGRKTARRLLGTEAQAARFFYPVLRFALNHDVEVAALTETVYRTMAENPGRFERIDPELLEVFVETLGYMLPGLVGPKRLEVLTTHGRTILDTPAEEQPRSVKRVRRDIQRVLESWGPPLSPEEALARLKTGASTAEEIDSLLHRLTPQMRETLDLDALLGPLIDEDGFRVLGLLAKLRPGAARLGKLDQRVIGGVLRKGRDEGFVPQYLRFTGRGTWDLGRAFIESGLQQAETEGAGAFAVAALGLGQGPPADWIRWALKTYTFPAEVRLALERRAK